MISVNMHEAKSRLSQLVLAALEGQEVILCNKGEPKVRLVPLKATPTIRRDLIAPDPSLGVTLAPGYDPTEPLGKLHLSQPPLQWYEALCRHYHLTELPLRTELLCAAANLPLIHRDPFDRVLVAIAQQQNLTILTSDQVIPTYHGVSAVW